MYRVDILYIGSDLVVCSVGTTRSDQSVRDLEILNCLTLYAQSELCTYYLQHISLPAHTSPPFFQLFFFSLFYPFISVA